MSSGKQQRCALWLIPLLALAAFAAVTPTAQAASPPHYFVNGLGPGARAAGGEKLPTIEWGALSLTNLTTGGKVSCHYVIGGVVENPEPGGETSAGVGETQSLGAYECESEACAETTFKAYVSVLPARRQ